ncbi:hypothetical protein B0H14DRAFT_2828564 [Mycena olivaceomarginata]|nr:hypothetical protein B0H14DRAFT_2828564 [Mycena olivaceomarginata]
MLIIVVYLYASAVAQFVLDVLTTFDAIYYYLMISDTPFPDRLPRADESLAFATPPLEALFIPVSNVQIIRVIIGDGVVIWRTWAIYQRRLLAILMPSILLLGLFSSVVIDTICYNNPLPGVEQICPWSGLIFWTFSIATNITCTIMIGFKAWQHRKMMRELNLSGTHSRTPTERILSLLVESGFIYILLWATEIIVWLNYSRDSPLQYAFEVISPMGNQIAGMIGNDISLNTLQWDVKREPTDTLVTEGRVDVHRDTVVEITPETYESTANVKYNEI